MPAAILLAAALTFAGTQPQLAASGSQVYLTFGAGDAIAVARSDDAGATFAPPVTLPAAGKLSLGRHRGPRIAATGRAVLVSAVAGEKGGGADGDVLLYRSLDGGRTWAAPIRINDVAGSAREGLHAMAANASGVVAIAWLDLRQKGTRIYAAVSRDHGKTWSADVLAFAEPSGAVCECCHPSIAVDARGRVAVMFRNNRDGRRDMYVVQSADGVTFGGAVKQGAGSWTLGACPMDGGGLALRDGSVWSAWRRETTVYAVAAGGAEVALGEGRDPAVAAAPGGLDVAWTSAEGVELRQAGGASRRVGPGGFATLLADDRGTLVAWEREGRVQVERVGR